jgi:hypothetical protein
MGQMLQPILFRQGRAGMSAVNKLSVDLNEVRAEESPSLGTRGAIDFLYTLGQLAQSFSNPTMRVKNFLVITLRNPVSSA